MPTETQTGFVYFLQAKDGNADPIKIGFTGSNPNGRTRDLQVGCPWPIEILGAVAADRTEEARLHYDLRSHRIRGEWFRPHAEVLEAIAEAVANGTPWNGPTRKHRSRTPSSEIIDALGGTAAVCLLTGASPGSVSNWRRFGKFPAGKFVRMRDALRAKGIDAPPSLWGQE